MAALEGSPFTQDPNTPPMFGYIRTVIDLSDRVPRVIAEVAGAPFAPSSIPLFQ